MSNANVALQPQEPLTAEQEGITRLLKGALLMLAPVGSGKTRVLADRVANAVASGIPPERILCLTFTNRAAGEMKDRLRAQCPDAVPRLNVHTFHGFCSRILRAESKATGLPADFVIYDEDDCHEIVRDHFRLMEENDCRQRLALLETTKANAEGGRLSLYASPAQLFSEIPPEFRQPAARYQEALRRNHALDFDDLVYYVRALFTDVPESLDHWSRLFDFIQVDEAQDTHFSEYDVISRLARRHGNVALIGDLDQTIYEWRGSQPLKIVERFRQDFHPAEHTLSLTYRATRSLINAAESFGASFERRFTACVPAQSCPEGEPILVSRQPDGAAEGRWIARQIRDLARLSPGFRYSRTAVLTRKHERSLAVCKALKDDAVPCITVEEYDFFRRQEVKDALALLRLIQNPQDSGALRRALLRPPSGIGEVTLRQIAASGATCGLHLADLALPEATARGRDPFDPLIDATLHGAIVVLDTETTGLDSTRDEVVEIAALRVEPDGKLSRYHAWIRNTVPVGLTERIHGWSDAHLRAKGRPSAEVFNEFLLFIRDAVLVGHNLSFDLRMLNAHLLRKGLSLPPPTWFDTCELARRFCPDMPAYTLVGLCRRLKLPVRPTHRAEDDVDATHALLKSLLPLVEASALVRTELAGQYAGSFAALANRLATWRTASQTTRPPDLLRQVLTESGLLTFYQRPGEARRLEHLAELQRIFQERDDTRLPPPEALRTLSELATLSRNVDQLSEKDNRVPIITIHQAKGLEFDNVFIAGASEGEIPSYYAVRDGRVEEERRLFYVAMTRARRRLYISSHSMTSKGYRKDESPFVSSIAPAFLQR